MSNTDAIYPSVKTDMTNTIAEVDALHKKWRAEAEANKNKEAKLRAEVNTYLEMQTNASSRTGRYFWNKMVLSLDVFIEKENRNSDDSSRWFEKKNCCCRISSGQRFGTNFQIDLEAKLISFLLKPNYFKRLSLVKTTSWQHRFFDLTNLAPMWLRTYEYMKNTLQN